MKKNFVFAAAFSLFVFAFAVSAQDPTAVKVTNFSGVWTLDVSKSKLDERARIESQVLTVTQTDKDIKVETATKRLPPPADAPSGGGRMGGGGMGGGDTAMTYGLDGKETKIEVDGRMGKMPVTLKAKFDGGKLTLSQSRTFSSPMGEVSIASKDTWELPADGRTLNVKRESTGPRGSESSTLVFVKKVDPATKIPG